jgi:hypothetical protein
MRPKGCSLPVSACGAASPGGQSSLMDTTQASQGLLEHLLSHGFLRRVAREKGCFRTFLLGARRNYLLSLLSKPGAVA